jgi:hypothetical protein
MTYKSMPRLARQFDSLYPRLKTQKVRDRNFAPAAVGTLPTASAGGTPPRCVDFIGMRSKRKTLPAPVRVGPINSARPGAA